MSSRKHSNDSATSSRSNRTANRCTATEISADKLFEPSVEMMVNDFDDESTLELEEALASSEAEDPNAELTNLQREGDMPIEELLALYNCVSQPILATTASASSASSRRSSKASRNANKDKVLMPAPTEIPPIEQSSHTKSLDKGKLGAITEPTEEVVNTPKENKIKDTLSSPVNTKELAALDNECETKSTDYGSDQNTNNLALDENEPSVDHKHNTKKCEDSSTDLSDKQQNDSGENVKVDEIVKKSSAGGESNKVAAGFTIDEEYDDEDDEEDEESELRKLYPETFKTSEPRLLRANSQPNSEDEEEEDIDYSPEEDEFKKKIMVGSEYQAQIPEGLCRYDDALPYENEDKLVWDPSQLQECDIELYLQKVNIPVIVSSPSNTSTAPSSTTISSTSPPTSITHQAIASKSPLLPCGNHLRDDEQSLYLLLQCGHNMEEALRRRRLNATLPPVVAVAAAATASHPSPGNDTRMSLWSEEECRNFESGLRVYGKDFHTIQQSKVRTRSVSELVQFYYLWKKTERHDIFANKARLEKKKYNLHPGLTDYMDRFLEEQENNGAISIANSCSTLIGSSMGGNNMNNSNGNEHAAGRDRSISPVVNSLLYTDYKRQRMSHTETSLPSPTITSNTPTHTIIAAGMGTATTATSTSLKNLSTTNSLSAHYWNESKP